MNAAAFRSFGRQSFTGITGACLMAFWATGSWAADPAPALRLSHELRAVPAEPSPSPSPPTASGPVGHWADQAEAWLPGNTMCDARRAPPWDRLSLDAALAHALCQNPGLRQAMAEVSEQTAGIVLAEIEGSPRISANADYSTSRNFNASGNSGRTMGASIGLSWVLFDFGQRHASLQAARHTWTAAMANQNNSVLTAVNELVVTYGDAVKATAALAAASEALNAASQTAAAAQARYDAKVGNQIEWLQAQTAQAQARLERVRASGAWASARTALALGLGADPGQPLQLGDWATWSQPPTPSVSANELALLDQETMQNHPRLRTIRAQIDALHARLQAVDAASRGSISVNAGAGSSQNWGAAGDGVLPTTQAAIVASFPLFNGRETQAAKAQVQARIAARQAEMDALAREVRNQLWQAHQAVRVSEESLLASASLLTSAERTFQVAQGRYKAGVGSVGEVLDAQSALAEARRQKVAAQVERLTSLTQLSVATGRLTPPPAAAR